VLDQITLVGDRDRGCSRWLEEWEPHVLMLLEHHLDR
jgi:hypothetical protein